MRNQVPCKGCTKRYLGCHAECSMYNEYKDTRDLINASRKKYNDKTEEALSSIARCIK